MPHQPITPIYGSPVQHRLNPLKFGAHVFLQLLHTFINTDMELVEHVRQLIKRLVRDK